MQDKSQRGEIGSTDNRHPHGRFSICLYQTMQGRAHAGKEPKLLIRLKDRMSYWSRLFISSRADRKGTSKEQRVGDKNNVLLANLSPP